MKNKLQSLLIASLKNDLSQLMPMHPMYKSILHELLYIEGSVRLERVQNKSLAQTKLLYEVLKQIAQAKINKKKRAMIDVPYTALDLSVTEKDLKKQIDHDNYKDLFAPYSSLSLKFKEAAQKHDDALFHKLYRRSDAKIGNFYVIIQKLLGAGFKLYMSGSLKKPKLIISW